ncbi:MAG: O-antigen ligase family protein, partial [Usitatibacter sp.]
MTTLLVAATAAFLFLAPFAGSAGLRAAMLFIAVLALVAARGRTLFRGEPRFPRDVGFAYAAWVSLAIASVAWSGLPEYTLSELRAEALYGTLAFLVFFYAATDASRWRMWWGAIMAGSLVVLLGTILQGWLPFEISRHPVDGGPGPWSTHLVLIAPLLFVLAWPLPWGEERSSATLAAALFVVLVAAWDTENRIVWGALGVQLAAAVALWKSMPAMEATRHRNFRGLAAITALAMVIAFAASIVERNERLFTTGSPFTASLERDLRPAIWAVAWTKFKDAPWLGHGFGREILAAEFLPITPKTYVHPPVLHSHNMLADIALQLGIAGLAAFVALLLALTRQYWRFLRDPAIAPLGIIGLAVIAGFLVKNLTDDFLHR